MQDHRDRSARAGRRAETTLKTTFWAGKYYVWHGTWLTEKRLRALPLADNAGDKGMKAYIGWSAHFAIK